FVERRTDPADRRAWRLYLTPKAAPVLERMTEIGEASLAHAMAGLSAAEIDAVTRMLNRIKANLADARLAPQSLIERDGGIEPARLRAGGRRG
ncbi:MAG TPA: hypothetical protein VMF53_00715, partial [Alphaproteobacteria bacterium]|nr:hypothetical protein [Alphaproteobacteria bacterium]